MFANNACSRYLQVQSSYLTPLTQGGLYTATPAPRCLLNKLKLSHSLVFKMDLDPSQRYSSSSKFSLHVRMSVMMIMANLTHPTG